MLPTEPASVEVLRAAGVTKKMLDTQLRNQRILRLRRGVYVAASQWPDTPAQQHILVARAEVVANPGGVISHQSAAITWQLPSPTFDPWHAHPASITLPSGAGHGSQRRQAWHHVLPLPVSHLTRDPAGYPITTVARTAVDLAADLELPQALGILDAAARQLCGGYLANPRRRDYLNPRLVAAARAELSAVASHRRIARLLPMIERADPARESVAESLSAGHFLLAGLPEPDYQFGLETAMGVVFPDCYWPRERLVGECDGAVKYRQALGYVREKEREQALRDAEYPVVRWLAKEIMLTPQVVVERVARALAHR